MNVLCDSRAKSHLLDCIRLQSEVPGDAHLHREGLRVSTPGGCKIYSDVCQAAMEQAAENDFYVFALSRHLFTEVTYPLVNWGAVGVAFRDMPDAFRLWAVKFVSGFSGTAVHMHRWHGWTSPLCPCCGLVPETTSHLLSCTAPALAQARESGMARIDAWLGKWSTHPQLHQVLMAMYGPAAPSFPAHLNLPVTSALALAFAQQLSVGLTNFWYGRHVQLWESFQTTYYISLSHRRSGQAWAAGLIRLTLEFGHSLWLARNAVVHARQLRGLDLMEAGQLESTIREQYNLGITNLLPADLHLLQSRTLEDILSLPADQKRVWVRSILLARELGEESLDQAHPRMSSTMRHWLGL